MRHGSEAMQEIGPAHILDSELLKTLHAFAVLGTVGHGAQIICEALVEKFI